LYVFGDDAPYLLILSPGYQVMDSVYFLPGVEGRIPKDTKHDIESAMIGMQDNQPVLYGIGSMSTKKRWGVIAYNLSDKSFKDSLFFEPGKIFPGIDEVNIEGSCTVSNIAILANRANESNPNNHLLFIDKQSATVKRMLLPARKLMPGLSGLYYVKEKDLLLFTASEEETGSSTSDGAIGDSYLGWIENFSKKMGDTEYKPDQFIRLADTEKAFNKQKIESVCVESVDGNNLIIHLTADNDNGRSSLFKLKLKL
jgi:hypothetical protein